MSDGKQLTAEQMEAIKATGQMCHAYAQRMAELANEFGGKIARMQDEGFDERVLAAAMIMAVPMQQAALFARQCTVNKIEPGRAISYVTELDALTHKYRIGHD